MSGAYRVPADAASSSSPPFGAQQWSSPPSSPTLARASSHASADPFSGSAKTLHGSVRRAFGRAATTPARAHDADVESLTLVPGQDSEARVLEQFFESSEEETAPSSDDALSSSLEASTSFLPRTRSFARTDSASTDPLSALGAPRPEPKAQRMRMVGTSPKKLTRAQPSDAPLPAWEQNSTDKAPWRRAGAVQWHALVNRIFDEGKEAPALLLGGCHVEQIPSIIGDLHSYVAIAPRRADDGTRTESQRDRARSLLQCYLWDNQLTRLPSALFQLTNLGVLSLRKNTLTHLPAAIGELHALRELNIGGNALSYLPAEIQRLELDTFTYVPNPFLALPSDAVLSQRPRHARRTEMAPPPVPRWARAQTESSTRWQKRPEDAAPIVRALGPLARHAVPTLAEVCIRRLLGDSDDGVLLDQYETGCLHALQFTLDVRLVAQLEAARRSAARLWGTPTNAPLAARRSKRRAWYEDASFHRSNTPPSPGSEASASSLGSYAPSALDVDQLLEHAEDACANPYFNRCPNPSESAAATDGVSDWPTAPYAPAPPYAHPSEERIEWVSHVAGVRVARQGIELLVGASDAQRAVQYSGLLPLLWRGCSPGCLDFLEA